LAHAEEKISSLQVSLYSKAASNSTSFSLPDETDKIHSISTPKSPSISPSMSPTETVADSRSSPLELGTSFTTSPKVLSPRAADENPKPNSSSARLGKFLKRSASTAPSSEDANALIAKQEPSVSLFEHQKLFGELENERAGKEILEEEIARLRRISIDLNAQIDSLRRSNTSNTVGNIRRRSLLSPSSSMSLPGAPLHSEDRERNNSHDKGKESTTREALRRKSLKPGNVETWTNQWDDEDDDDDSSDVLSQESETKSQSSSADKLNPARRLSNSIVSNPTNRLEFSNGAAKTEKARVNSISELVVGKFEKNMENWKTKLAVGVKCLLWMGHKLVKVESTLKYDAHNEVLNFDVSSIRKGFGLFTRQDNQSISIKAQDIFECLPGAEIPSEAADEARFITIVTSSDTSPSLILAFKVDNKEERNNLITGLRAIIAETHGKPEDILSNYSRNPSISNEDGFSSSNPNFRTTRRLSVRDVVLEETISSSSGSVLPQSQSATFKRMSVKSASSNSATKDLDVGSMNSSEELRRLLVVERTNKERLFMQSLSLTNDLNERDEQIFALKKRDAELTSSLMKKDKIYEQDALVRIQLGKRLEQVLMDKEEALEQYELLKEKCEILKASVALIQPGK